MSLQRRDEIVIGAQSTITYLTYTTATLDLGHHSSTATLASTSTTIEYYPSLTIDLPNPKGTTYVKKLNYLHQLHHC
jgi:hypothetical protein